MQGSRCDQLAVCSSGDDFLVALGADAVAELHAGVAREVAFELLPVIAVVADFLAVAANRQQALQLMNLGQGILQFADALGNLVLQRRPSARRRAGGPAIRGGQTA